MAVETQYKKDVAEILSHRHDNGADFWATPDGRLFVGSPFSTLGSSLFLHELGMEPTHEALQGAAQLFFSVWKPDGRFKVYPKGSIYPCQTAMVAHLLCELGYQNDARVQKTLVHLLETPYEDGGWRCNKFYFGRGPETEHSNPMPTMAALNAFRFTEYCNNEPKLDKAVEFLLSHWVTRVPIGPCHYGIGSRFMQVEYPFRGYNLFQYVYVLSHYKYACRDERFLQALAALTAQTQGGQIVVQRVVPKLARLAFCKKGEVSKLATRHYKKIHKNVEENSK